MIQILTDKRLVKGQLSVLIRELGYEPMYHETPVSLLNAATNSTGNTAIFFDLDVIRTEQLTRACADLPESARKIGFQVLGQNTKPIITEKPEALDYFFILPPNAERAKSRLKTAFRGSDYVEGPDRATTRSGLSGGARRFTRSAMPFKPSGSPFKGSKETAAPFPRQSQSPFKSVSPFASIAEGNRAVASDARYIVAHSTVSRNLLKQMSEIKKPSSFVLLAGNEGADFESVAREFNFQSNKDHTQLMILNEEEINVDYLEKAEKAAAKAQLPTICYLGKSENLNQASIEATELFIDFLENLRNPHLRLVLAHEYGTEEFLPAATVEFIKKVHKVRPTVLIPDLKDRDEDIAPLALKLLNTLRSAHPFLNVRNISESALGYLIEHRAELNETKLIRILRNCIALSHRSTLQIEDIKNYGEHDSATSHLVESMADEAYFPSSHTA